MSGHENKTKQYQTMHWPGFVFPGESCSQNFPFFVLPPSTPSTTSPTSFPFPPAWSAVCLIFPSEVCIFQPEARFSHLLSMCRGGSQVWLSHTVHLCLPLLQVSALSLGVLVPTKSHIKWHFICHPRTLVYIYKLHSWRINLTDFFSPVPLSEWTQSITLSPKSPNL